MLYERRIVRRELKKCPACKKESKWKFVATSNDATPDHPEQRKKAAKKGARKPKDNAIYSNCARAHRFSVSKPKTAPLQARYDQRRSS